MKRLLLLLAMALVVAQCMGQYQDSVHNEEIHKFSAAGLIAPGILFTTGCVGHASDGLHQYDILLRDRMAEAGLKPRTIDNYIQYVPYAAVLGLRLCGIESEHQFRDLIPICIETYLVGGLAVTALKSCVDIQRPDSTSFNSFPSGHTFTAFSGAEILRREYGSEHPLIAIGGYLVATGVGFMRFYNSRHWLADILGGAGIGILAASASYWTYPALNRWITGKNCRLTASPTALTLEF